MVVITTAIIHKTLAGVKRLFVPMNFSIIFFGQSQNLLFKFVFSIHKYDFYFLSLK